MCLVEVSVCFIVEWSSSYDFARETQLDHRVLWDASGTSYSYVEHENNKGPYTPVANTLGELYALY